jgi:large subunit ribosomal protein L2
MKLKEYKPQTPGRRGMTGINYREALTTQEPYKPLTSGRKRDVGRNNAGRITAPHKGSGHKRLYRQVDFKFAKRDVTAKIETIEYDPNRTAFLNLICYADGTRSYVLATKGLKVGDTITVSEKAPLTPGNRLPLRLIPVGTAVHSIEIHPNGGAKMIRSAGTFAQIIAHNEGKTLLKMPSTETRMVMDTAWATIGELSNSDWKLVNFGKAGRARWRGIRPTVRGSAMNPVDHPHGGGEQKQGIGLRRGPKTRQGKLAYGVKTRSPKKYSNVFVVTRRKTKRNQ